MSEIHYEDDNVTLWHGDCLDVLAAMPEASVDAIVCDPPYGLGFMGKQWDELPPGEEWARACLRVLKPGGHLLAFGGTRTWHRLAVAVEDAGFEIRDGIAWLYGSGFPKSLDVSKAIDKAAGAEREVVGNTAEFSGRTVGLGSSVRGGYEGGAIVSGHCRDITAPATPEAERWQGWGTALKPAFEPVVVARKPLVGTVAANVLEHGTGALNIDGCRIGTEARVNPPSGSPGANAYRLTGGDGRDAENARRYAERSKTLPPTQVEGRWPANVVLDESQAEVLDEQSGERAAGAIPANRAGLGYMGGAAGTEGDRIELGGGGASRFYYVAKAPKKERPVVDGVAHPTVKPLALMRWLVRLVTPPSGLVLDPFAGSGTTAEAAMLEGFQCIAIEREADYLPLIVARLTRHQDEPPEPDDGQLDLFEDGAA